VQRKKTGKLDALILSMQRFSEKLGVIGAHSRNKVNTRNSREIGPGRPRSGETNR